MKVLIVDDEDMIRNVLKEYVEFEGNEAFEAADGMEAVRMCRDNDYDVILMDVMMPRLDGFSAVKEIRKTKDVPVIMLSARGEEYDKLFGFEIGVDDYVTKPFSPKILIARVKSLLRRSPSKAAGRIVSTPHGVSLDTGKRKCFVSGEEIPLTATEFDILLSLISADGCVRRRTEIIEEIKGDDYPVTERSIDVQIAALRKKLGSAGRNIATVWGIGYRYAEE